MALSGTFSSVYKGYTYQISWTATQNISKNCSTITCTHKLICEPTYSLHIGSRSNTCVVNKKSQSFTSDAINTDGGATITLGKTTHTVNHNSDGTGRFSITGTFNMQATIVGVYVNSIVTSGKATLTTIPRASSITSASNITLPSYCSIKWTPASSTFKYKIKFSLGSWNYTTEFITPKTTIAYTYDEYKISGTTTANKTTIYKQLSSSTSGTMTATLTTYNSKGTKIGSASSKTFTVTIPSTVVPTVGTITLNPADINSKNILVQNKNKFTVSVSGCSAGSGSSIKSYTFSGSGLSSKTTTDTSVSGGPISRSGELSYTVKVTDNRGRTASKTISYDNGDTICYCYAYSAPYFTSFSAYRSDSSGTENNNGTHIKCSFGINFASVNKTNNVTVQIFYKKSTASSYSSTTVLANSTSKSGSKILGSIALDSTYIVYATVTDNYSGKSTSSTITVFGSSRILNISKDGTGFAIGKMAESNNLFECRWNAKFDGTASGPSGFSTSSDRRVKKNIQDIDIDIVDNLQPIQYELVQSNDNKIHYGFIAQDVEKLLSDAGLNPELTGIIGQIQNNGQQEYVLTYTEFIPLLTKKCQELQAEINILKEEISELKSNTT